MWNFNSSNYYDEMRLMQLRSDVNHLIEFYIVFSGNHARKLCVHARKFNLCMRFGYSRIFPLKMLTSFDSFVESLEHVYLVS